MRMFSISQLYPSDRPMNPYVHLGWWIHLFSDVFPSYTVYVVPGFRKYLKSDPILTHNFLDFSDVSIASMDFQVASRRQACHIPSTTAARALSSTWTAMPWAPRWGIHWDFVFFSKDFKRIWSWIQRIQNGISSRIQHFKLNSMPSWSLKSLQRDRPSCRVDAIFKWGIWFWFAPEISGHFNRSMAKQSYQPCHTFQNGLPNDLFRAPGCLKALKSPRSWETVSCESASACAPGFARVFDWCWQGMGEWFNP